MIRPGSLAALHPEKRLLIAWRTSPNWADLGPMGCLDRSTVALVLAIDGRYACVLWDNRMGWVLCDRLRDACEARG